MFIIHGLRYQIPKINVWMELIEISKWSNEIEQYYMALAYSVGFLEAYNSFITVV